MISQSKGQFAAVRFDRDVFVQSPLIIANRWRDANILPDFIRIRDNGPSPGENVGRWRERSVLRIFLVAGKATGINEIEAESAPQDVASTLTEQRVVAGVAEDYPPSDPRRPTTRSTARVR